jgi:hypothetical protein
VTQRRRWLIGIAAASLYLGANAFLGGLRSDHFGLAAAGVAILASRGRAREVGLFLAPLLIMAAVYDAQRYWAAALRMPVHVAGPSALEILLFGIDHEGGRITPAAWCQLHTRPWLDLICGAAYLLFLPAFVGVAAWWRFLERRTAAQDVMWAMLWMNLAAYATYLLCPVAPPWYVDHYGLGPAVLSAAPESAGGARFDALLRVSWFAGFYGRNTNVFGAVPSLHVGQTFLALIYAWRFASLRVFLSAYFAVLAFASVYLNHHYIIDGLAGMAFALAAEAGMRWYRRLGQRGSAALASLPVP